MKKSIILLLLLVGYVIVFDISAEQKPIGLNTQSKEKILSLTTKEDPGLFEALMPEDKKGIPISLSSIPIHVTNKAVYWIKKAVRSQWLPPEIEKNLVAIKDVKWEWKDNYGDVHERKGDFLILEYESGGNFFHIQESGVSVSVRIDLLMPKDITADPKSFISWSLKEFLDLPSGVLDLSFSDIPPLFKATNVPAGSIDPLRDWWESVVAYTDGNFFFVTFLELDNSKGSNRFGLPDRF
jgi:hypothetical protein